MDIQKVFLRQAHLYLNSSLVVLIPGVIFILLNILLFSKDILMVFVLPFLVYSLFLFQNYLLNYKRFLFSAGKIEKLDKPDFFSSNQYLLYFAKEENELLFLHPTGVMLGKIIEKKTQNTFNLESKLYPKEFILVDFNENYLSTFFWTKDTIDNYQKEYGYVGSLSYEKERTFTKLSGEEVGISKCEPTFFDDYIKNNHDQVVLRVRKGWMPLKYQELFQNPNQPLLTLSPGLEEREKLFYFSLLIKKFFK